MLSGSSTTAGDSTNVAVQHEAAMLAKATAAVRRKLSTDLPGIFDLIVFSVKDCCMVGGGMRNTIASHRTGLTMRRPS